MLGDLDQYIDFTMPLNLGHTIIQSSILSGYFSGVFGPVEFSYTSIIVMLVMIYVAAAYNTVKAVDAAVHSTVGFYFDYAGYSALGN